MDNSALFGLIVLAAIGLIMYFVRLGHQSGQAKREREDKSQVIIKTYKGNQNEAKARFQADAIEMAARGYFPTSQSWAPGQWGAGAFIIALLLCFLIIGFVGLIYMLIVRPDGTLTVTYELRAASVAEKTCPMCAEKIKAAALVCHYCGHKFELVEEAHLARPSFKP